KRSAAHPQRTLFFHDYGDHWNKTAVKGGFFPAVFMLSAGDLFEEYEGNPIVDSFRPEGRSYLRSSPMLS
ncbi:hypothetical protein U1Q18_049804, partial [Sarracenia purpurea var. burkii]